jgi:acyl-CoA synthetase (AMP-forming)/AMP-acid ligase II
VSPAPAFQLADLFEATADAVPERVPLVAGDARRTFRELEANANRLAHVLAAHGTGPGDTVGIYARNCVEWIEAMLAVFKLRAAVVNVNHRYVDDELVYLFNDAGIRGLIFAREFAPRVAAALPRTPDLTTLISIDDGTQTSLCELDTAIGYADALDSGSPERDFVARSGDDRYLLYTGGTTGLPKGVVWRHEDFFYACLQGGAGAGAPAAATPADLARRAVADPPVRILLLAGAMHHASGQWGMLSTLLMGARAVLLTGTAFDPHRAWDLVERHRVTKLAIVGDAMARPLADALAAGRPNGGRYDTSSVVAIGSGGAILSPAVQAELRALLPGIELSDVMGSSESGLFAFQVLDTADATAGTRPRFVLDAVATVVGDDGRPVPIGGEGRLAVRGRIPLGYHNDPDRNARTFPVIDGVRHVVPGDHAILEADGVIRLLGRGSVCINTGGEKVYPEEVEAVLKDHSAVFDAVVVGVADDRLGERVAAVVHTRVGADPDADELVRHCRARLAAFKVPRVVRFVDEVVRHSSGKPDYRWAAEVARD